MTTAATVTQEKPSTAVQPQQARSAVPAVPNDFGDIWRMADALSRAGMLPPALRGSQADVALMIMAGRDLGLTFTAALRGIHVFDGRITMAASLMAARGLESGIVTRYEVVKNDPEECVVHAYRVGVEQPFIGRFSMAMARQITAKGGSSMKLADKDNWKNYPEDMLYARATARAFRKAAPEVLFGIYDPDEVDEIKAATPTSTVTVVDQKPPETKSVAALANLAKKKADPAAATNAQAPTSSLQPPQEATGAETAATNARATPTLLQPTTPTVEPDTASALEEPPLEDEQAPAAPAPAARVLLSGKALILEIERLAPLLGGQRFRKCCEALGGDPGGIGFGLGLDGQRALLDACKAALDKKAT